MKQPFKVFILLFFTAMSFTGCKDEAIKIDRHFIGIWNGTDGIYTYHLSIDNRSNGYWEQDNAGKYQYAQGVAKVRHDDLNIGLRSFEIGEYPVQDSTGIWNMVLSNVLYRKQ